MKAALTLLVCVSCVYNPHFESGKTKCSPEGLCPPGFECKDTDAGPGRSCFQIVDAARTSDAPQGSGDALLSDAAVPSDTQPDVPSPEVPSDARDAAIFDGPVDAPPDTARDTTPPPPDAPPDVACQPPPGCLAGAGTYCDGIDNIAKCEVDHDAGCVVRQVATKCPQGQCTGTAPNAVCRCAANPDPRCPGDPGDAGAGCASPAEIYTCADIGNHCIEFVSSRNCPIPTVCRGDYPNANCGPP